MISEWFLAPIKVAVRRTTIRIPTVSGDELERPPSFPTARPSSGPTDAVGSSGAPAGFAATAPASNDA